jgi:hypothetical protein
MRRLTVSLQGKQVGEVYTVTNEQSNLEKAVTSSLPNVPGKSAREVWLGYYITLLRIWWGTCPPRKARKLRKQEPELVSVIEGILKHGGH